MGDLAAVILAAGKGTRMKSRLPKVLHPLAGRPMIQYSVDLARALGANPIVVVVGHEAEGVRQALRGEELFFVTQEPQLGTGHAVSFARGALADHGGDTLILCGDVPLFRQETLEGLVECHRATRAALTVLVGRMENPYGYGRIVRAPGGEILRVVEERDATDAQRSIPEVNTGIYCARTSHLFRAVDGLEKENAQGEYYLTDIVEILSPERVSAFPLHAPEEFLGINDRVDLARAEGILQDRLRTRWMREGVTLMDPKTVFLDAGVRLGMDTVVEPHVTIRGRTTIGSGCRVGSGCSIEDSTLEDGVTVAPSSVILGSRVGEGAAVGAGSTITRDVPPGALAVSRTRQVNLPGKALRGASRGKGK